MCGIAGFWGSNLGRDDRVDMIRSMVGTLRHRGPDSSGIWTDSPQCPVLGHSRLSIVELSALGAQPMESSSGRTVITFNGEIYNHDKLRTWLASEGVSFRGGSDTEVLLEGIERYGVEAMLAKCNGEFAAAVFDKISRKLTLFRDRLGIKPLYYGVCHNTLVFASELKALRVFNDFDFSVEMKALSAYLRLGYIPGNLSIYTKILKLPAGCFIDFDFGDLEKISMPLPKHFWQPRDHYDTVALHSFEEVVGYVDSRLQASVDLRRMADVPLGAFLSGGIDSSLVVSMLSKLSSSATKTFSIGFEDSSLDEAPYAERVARHLGTDHTSLYVTASQAQDLLPQLIDLFDEPFADASAIPTYLVAKLARSEVVVSLSGDGGDELFGSYNHYATASRNLRRLGWVPLPLRFVVAKMPSYLSFLGSATNYKLEKLKEIFPQVRRDEVFLQTLGHWQAGDFEVIKSLVGELEELEDMQYFTHWDLRTYLVDDILVKLDRTTMAVGLEGRVPMLDHTFVESVLKIPPHLRFLPNKQILRGVLAKYLPRELFERPKSGFSVPLGDWLRGPLRDWSEDLLNGKSLVDEVLDPKLVLNRWNEHLNRKADWKYLLWDVLVARAWCRKYT
jgi:asparagine synthase (glutamine-hydrolysing)